jgi:hypothetical protein
LSGSECHGSFVRRKGRVHCIAPSGFPTGVYRIQFGSPAPNNTYVVSLAQIGTGNIKIWDSSSYLPSVNSFHVVTSNASFTLANWAFHFSVAT